MTLVKKTNNVWDPNLGLKMSRNIIPYIFHVFSQIHVTKVTIMLYQLLLDNLLESSEIPSLN
jgi:hypothetical protein